MQLSIHDQFTPDVLGIFWLTKEDLNRDLTAFDDLNYLFDGLISQYIYGQDDYEKKHAHIFFSENFDERVFLAHLRSRDLTKSQVSGDIDEQVALVAALGSSKKVILVLDTTGENWHSELKKRYQQFEFKVLEIN